MIFALFFEYFFGKKTQQVYFTPVSAVVLTTAFEYNLQIRLLPKNPVFRKNQRRVAKVRRTEYE